MAVNTHPSGLRIRTKMLRCFAASLRDHSPSGRRSGLSCHGRGVFQASSESESFNHCTSDPAHHAGNNVVTRTVAPCHSAGPGHCRPTPRPEQLAMLGLACPSRTNSESRPSAGPISAARAGALRSCRDTVPTPDSDALRKSPSGGEKTLADGARGDSDGGHRRGWRTPTRMADTDADGGFRLGWQKLTRMAQRDTDGQRLGWRIPTRTMSDGGYRTQISLTF
jgi:hypothetical protein